MESIYRITGFNGNTVPYYPNNDKGVQATGLKEGLLASTSRTLPRSCRESGGGGRLETLWWPRAFL